MSLFNLNSRLTRYREEEEEQGAQFELQERGYLAPYQGRTHHRAGNRDDPAPTEDEEREAPTGGVAQQLAQVPARGLGHRR